MGLWQKTFPEHDLTLRVYAGAITAEEVIRSYEALDAGAGSRWLTFVDLAEGAPHRIIDDIPVERFPEIKRAVVAKTKALFGGRRVRSAIVCRAEAFDETADFWRAYAAADEKVPVDAAFFTSVMEACAWLGLTDAACAAVSSAIEAGGPSDDRKTKAQPLHPQPHHP